MYPSGSNNSRESTMQALVASQRLEGGPVARTRHTEDSELRLFELDEAAKPPSCSLASVVPENKIFNFNKVCRLNFS